MYGRLPPVITLRALERTGPGWRVLSANPAGIRPFSDPSRGLSSLCPAEWMDALCNGRGGACADVAEFEFSVIFWRNGPHHWPAAPKVRNDGCFHR